MYRTAYLTLMVRDIDQSVRFYTQTLGLPLKERYGDHWAGVEAPGVTIGLHPAGDHPSQRPRGDAISLGLLVDDLDAAVQELTGRGVTFSRITGNESARSAYFSDPDGVTLYLMQRS